MCILDPPQTVMTFNLSKPSSFFTYHQVRHSKILQCALFLLSVLCGSQKRQRLLPYAALADWFCITEVESVYSAVRTDSLHKTVGVWSLITMVESVYSAVRTDSLYKTVGVWPWWKVFTARYGLIPYIKQLAFGRGGKCLQRGTVWFLI